MTENFSMQIKRSNTDEWYTMPETVKLIVPFLRQNGYRSILCPFDKADSAFVTILKTEGFDVSYGHIEEGADFFDLKNHELKAFDAIVSNPPFSKREAVLEKLFAATIPFAMILNFIGLFDSFARWELFKRNKFELLIPRGRWRFFNKECEGNSPNFQSVYVCHGMAQNQIEFIGGMTDDESRP